MVIQKKKVREIKKTKINKLINMARRSKNKNKKNKNSIRVAVYGTLMSGLGLNYYLTSSTLLGEFQTPPTLQMYSAGGMYPYIMEKGNTSVTMEVYELNPKETLENLDRVEGVSGGLYKRKTIPTPYGEAFVYMREEKMRVNDNKITSGDWKEYDKNERADKLYMN